MWRGSAASAANPGCALAETAQPQSTTWYGDPAWVYRAGALTVTVLPRRGGKIASIRHHGREWLTQPRRPLIALDDLPAHLVDGDMFGWDECAPTIDDCEVMGVQLPLHGDAWDVPWSEREGGWLEVSGRHLPYTLGRRLTVRPAGFRLDYVATAPVRMPFLWAAHPQFAAGPESRVILGEGGARLIDIFARGYWPDAIAGAPVRLGEVPDGRSGKLFVDPNVTTGLAKLLHADGATATFRWDSGVAPYLGVWMDRAGIGPVDAIAIEPMTGYADSCMAAMQAKRVLWLEPDRPVRWWVDVGFSTG